MSLRYQEESRMEPGHIQNILETVLRHLHDHEQEEVFRSVPNGRYFRL